MYINTLSHYLPSTVVPNSYFEPVNGITDEWIEARTGIKERRKAGPDENTNTMAVEAVRKALPNLPFPLEELDLIVGATYSPYDTVSTLAHIVQAELGVNNIPAVSISSACSSTLNAMEIVEGYFAMGKAKHALVIVSEHNTAYANETDKVAGHLWGDGAAAIFVSKERQTDRDLKVEEIITGGAACTGKGTEGVQLKPWDGGIIMPHGRDVFINACQYMSETTREIIEKNGYKVSDLNYFIPHQANNRISQNVAGQLELTEEQVVSNIQYLGNTGCAGCAIGFSETQDKFKPGDLIVLAVFGGGYSYGAMLVKA
ncbi:ketoacyl-ACP synthase III [Pontibacter sp. G13]|uniref:3-oxoacyl-ACP synthase III family protein n=1 Tax=Pontibacter sp. G13 TaxID=3074898 RepID=UPI00288ADF00|nr:ketoacyl-ACP synthase III [Pontibacter sp. G13]WNJ19193.1 ketoacyl-ACP synthase III [Pontibacter sp. G13]